MVTIECSKCKQLKDITCFSRKTETKLHSYCKECHSKYRREHYINNKRKYIEKATKRTREERSRIAKIIAEIKNVPCVDCGEKFHPCAMDFDHIESNKIANVSMLAKGHSWEKIKQEIDKCEIVCANCHRIRTWVTRNK
jgi:hypothetical protein